jgi:hypothetical protein
MSGLPFPVDPELTGIVVAYRNGAYIADQVLPRLTPMLTKREFKFWRFGFGEAITLPDTRVGRKGQPTEVEFSFTETPSMVEDFGLDDFIPVDDMMNAPASYNPRTFAAQRLMDLILLDREQRVASTVFSLATYPAANRVTLSGTSQWSHASSTPIAAIMDAMDAMVMRPNVMVIGQRAWTQLRRNPQILQAISISGTSQGAASRQAVQELLELDEIVIGSAYVNTARPGQPVSQVRLWGNHAALIHRAPMATSLQGLPTFGWTAQYGTRISGAIDEPKRGLRGGTTVRAGESVREVIAASDLGYFFQNAVA